ncbi:MAG: GspE/PulE family protein [Candidatus Anammoxibacter sp.]
MGINLGRIGDQLIEKKLITEDELKLALDEQKSSGEPLGKCIQQLGFVDAFTLTSILATQAGVEVVNLEEYHVDSEITRLVSHMFARKNTVIPLLKENGILTICVSDPFNIMVIEEIERMTNLGVVVKAATEEDIVKAIDKFYGQAEFVAPVPEENIEVKKIVNAAAAVSSPIVDVVNNMIIEAIKKDATDIHIEPKEQELRLRLRIDGILQKPTLLLKSQQSGIITRLKVMANLDIAESRLPQDGKLVFAFGDKKVDIRMSTMASIHGENIVLRILNKENLILGLEQLGFSSRNLEIFKESITKPYGIVLVTGPTGSGKTTTLYSALANINSIENNIKTLEDPVEYELPEICQSQINLRAGLTFASGLRAILRQDPDVILVGEVRDAETVEVSVRAAITGHLVFSTLHTNDAVGAITRLIDMNVEPELLSMSLVSIIAQRLIRKICANCKEEIPVEKASVTSVSKKMQKELMEVLKNAVAEGKKDKLTVFQGKGCDRCFGTGYKGRLGIFEVVPISPEMRVLITKSASSHELKEKAIEEGMTTMLEEGFDKLLDGVTTIEELGRVAYA